MKIELKSREGCKFKKLCRSASEAHSDAELIIPDTLEDILRILCCRYQCRVREKTVSQDAVDISGEIDVTVIYIPDTGEGVRTVGTSVPFNVHFDAPGADSTSIAVTKINSLCVDAKAANPRKISLSSAVFMEQCSFKYADVCHTEPPDEKPDKLFFKTEELKYKSIALVAEKTISIEDELEPPETVRGGDFLKAFSSVRIDGSETVGTKLIVKGAADIEAVYIVSGTPRCAQFSLPFSQIFNLPDGCTEVEVSACTMVTGQYFEAFDDDRLSADIRAAVQIICLQDKSMSYISDAYSCTKQLCLTEKEFSFITDAGEAVQSAGVRLSYNSDYGADEIVFSNAFAGCPEAGESELSVPVTADIAYKDREGELRACRVRGMVQLELPYERKPDNIGVNKICISASAAGDGVSADITLTVTLQYLSFCSVGMISAVEETELEREKSSAALYMCRCSDGDLWSLAKKYGSDVELIKLINEIDDEPDDRLLLIPVI